MSEERRSLAARDLGASMDEVGWNGAEEDNEVMDRPPPKSELIKYREVLFNRIPEATKKAIEDGTFKTAPDPAFGQALLRFAIESFSPKSVETLLKAKVQIHGRIDFMEVFLGTVHRAYTVISQATLRTTLQLLLDYHVSIYMDAHIFVMQQLTATGYMTAAYTELVTILQQEWTARFDGTRMALQDSLGLRDLEMLVHSYLFAY